MRGRNLKPAFFGHPVLRTLPPSTRILFLGLTCLADRRGLVEDRPRMIKNAILPDDAVDVDAELDVLATVRDDDGSTLIRRYTGANGVRGIAICQFARHNSPHPREPMNPKLCPPDGEPGQATAGHGPATGGPPLTPDSLLLPADSGRTTSDARARAQVEHGPDPEGPEVAGCGPSVAGVVGALAGSLALDAAGRPAWSPDEAKRYTATRGAPIASDTQRGAQELASDPALDAARQLATARSRFDSGLVAEDVLASWARELDHLHAGGRWPWSEIGAVMSWAFGNDWWSPRIEDAVYFARHYTKMRGQWQAKLAGPQGLAERNLAAMERVLAELDGGTVDARDN